MSLKEEGSAELRSRHPKILNKQQIELARLEAMCEYERPYWDKGLLVAGIDEAGRGPLAGPCVAAAVVMPPNCLIPGVNDSKKLSEKKRQELFLCIKEKAICYGVGIVDNRVVDEINILNAAKRAFVQAFSALTTKPDFVLCDKIGGIAIDTEYEELVGGDRRSYSIAAASIIAKETRDQIMREYEDLYPEYGFAKHKGYGTPQHRASILEYGACDIHRMSFLKKIIS